MIPRRWILAYLRFLLRRRGGVTIVVAALTVFFAVCCLRLRLHTDFFDFYPKFRTFSDAFAACRRSPETTLPGCAVQAVIHPGADPYMQIYQDFRRMFGSANILTVILEVKHGDIYNPGTLQKLDWITKYLAESKGVNPEQILSIAHPRVKSVSSRAGSIQVQPIFHPGVPQSQGDADRVRLAVYADQGVRGFLTSIDDTAAVVHAGFWEEALDFRDVAQRIAMLKAQAEDNNHTIYVTGIPWLYTSILQYRDQVVLVFALTAAALAFLLLVYFRTWTGVWVPIFSGLLSTVWGLGIAVLLGFNLDPLVLVIPVFLTARALSHSVQSMDRYHEEYYRCGDKSQAILRSYSALFPPAIASIVADGIGLLVVAVAPIPLIQKVAIFACFWVVSIFVSVVTLHPIILSYMAPPSEPHATAHADTLPAGVGLVVLGASWLGALALHAAGAVSSAAAALVALPATAWAWWYYSERIYPAVTCWVIRASDGRRRWLVILLTVGLFAAGWAHGRRLEVGDLTPGAALLFRDHPYNIAFAKLNEKFLGASQLIVIVDTKHPDGLKNAAALTVMDEFASAMAGAPGASQSVTVVDVVKTLARLYHDGDPKWGLIPTTPKEIGQLFYVFTSSAQAGDLDRFMDPAGRYGTVLTLFRGYSHQIIMDALAYARRAAADHPSDIAEFKFAGGLFAVLAAVNQAVEQSYWSSLLLIFATVAICLYLTYGSWMAAAILMMPVVLAQVVSEALMVVMHIDLNVNSLPIAAAGAAVGVDYGIYHFSRMVDAIDEIGNLDEAVDYATATTGKAIIFTATTMIAGTIFWWFSDLKFQAEMGFLLALLMAFNTFGGLVIVPAFVKTIRPAFLVRRLPPGPPEPAAP